MVNQTPDPSSPPTLDTDRAQPPEGLQPEEFDHFQAAYLTVLRNLSTRWQFRVDPRGNTARESLNVGFTLTDPRARLPFIAARRMNLPFHLAETLWYLTGRDDVDMVAHYAPAIRKMSADGRVLTGTAYGPKLRRPDTPGGRSQWDNIIDLLRRDRDSKRAAIALFQATELDDPNNPDVTCTLGVQFVIRDNRLHASCYMRGNDAYRGLLGDVFAWTWIQEFLARQLNVPIGTYTHHATSMHLNDRDSQRAEAVLNDAGTWQPPEPAHLTMPQTATWDDIRAVAELEEALRSNTHRITASGYEALPLDEYWRQIVLVFELFRQATRTPDRPFDPALTDELAAPYRWLLAARWPDRICPARRT